MNIVNLRHEIKPGIVQVNLDKHRWYEVEQEDGSFNYYPSVTSILDEYPNLQNGLIIYPP